MQASLRGVCEEVELFPRIPRPEELGGSPNNLSQTRTDLHGGPAMKRAQFLALVGVTLGIVFSSISPARAQQQPLPVQPAPSASQNSSAAQSPTSAQQRADLVRKRAEWFQKQRAYPDQRIPAAALANATD